MFFYHSHMHFLVYQKIYRLQEIWAFGPTLTVRWLLSLYLYIYIYIYIYICVCVCVCVYVCLYVGTAVSAGNAFQDLPRLRETADNTDRYI
jgi:hypothetical protein